MRKWKKRDIDGGVLFDGDDGGGRRGSVRA